MQTFQAIMFFVVIGSAIWVGIDASHRDFSGSGFASKTWHWVVGILLLWIVVFPIYLFQRGKAAEKGVVATGNVAPLPQPEMYRTCPHCKEPMRRDAGVCPHCRNHSAAWTLHGGYWWFRANEQDGWQWLDEPNGRWLKHGFPSPPPASDPKTEESPAAPGGADSTVSPPARPRMLGEPIAAWLADTTGE